MLVCPRLLADKKSASSNCRQNWCSNGILLVCSRFFDVIYKHGATTELNNREVHIIVSLFFCRFRALWAVFYCAVGNYPTQHQLNAYNKNVATFTGYHTEQLKVTINFMEWCKDNTFPSYIQTVFVWFLCVCGFNLLSALFKYILSIIYVWL